MPAPDLIEFLRGLHFLRDVNEATLTELAPSLVRQEFGAGELILRQGAFPKALVLIAEGEASVSWAEPEAPPVELYRLGVGDTFGELELAYGETYHASLIALAPTTVYFWEQGALEAGLQPFPTALASLRYLAQSRRLALRLRFNWLGPGETVCG
ncbi:MAG TPA: cyclic nucleotide-binding domain-containing protein, partial [Anaerolineales bacterium]